MSTATGVFLLSLTAIPVTYFLNLVASWSQWWILVMAVGLLGLVTIAVHLLLRGSSSRNRIKDPRFYVFSLFAFTSVVDMIIGLELDGVIDNFVSFYLKEGEVYLNTAHGTMINYWDGTGQYCMYLMMITAIVWRQSYREVCLYWVGSIMNSLVVFMPGNIAGKHGGDLKASYILNLPFVILPLMIGYYALKEKPTYTYSREHAAEKQSKSLVRRPFDLLVVLYLILCSAFAFFRVLAAWRSPLHAAKVYIDDYEPYLKDPVVYPMIQVVANWFYLVPYYIFTIYGLMNPGCSWMPDWALIHAGISVQSQFTHIGAAVHLRTPYIYRIPTAARPLFYCINFTLLIVPQIMAWRYVYFPEYFVSLSHSSGKVSNGGVESQKKSL